MRKITVFQAANNSKKEFMTDATTWSQLKREMGDFFRSGMKAITLQGRITLEHDDATLPTGDFTLMLTPTAVKSGIEVVDMTSLMGSLRTKFNDSIDEVIEELENGEHMKSVDGASTSSSTLSATERAEMEKALKGL